MMGTKVIKIKRFLIKMFGFYGWIYQKGKIENENETKCIQNHLLGLPESYYKKRKAASVIGMRPFPIISVQSMV